MLNTQENIEKSKKEWEKSLKKMEFQIKKQ